MNALYGQYVVITPCRDEEEFIEQAIESLAAQTIRPLVWVIIDDGSSDRTPELLATASERHDFIRVVRREDRGERKVGPGVIEAFYAGYETLVDESFDFLCKMDADLQLPEGYFERLLQEMENEQRLGAVSGKMYLRDDEGKLHHERRGDDHAAGPTKFYRKVCFDEIGGFVRMVGWDGIDGHMCRMKNWIARSIDDDGLRVVHLRQMGSSHKGVLHGRVRGGQGKWRIGSSPWYLLATAVYRAADKPYVIGAIAMTFGYFKAMLTGVERMNDPEYVRHLRRYEWSALFGGKRRTLRTYNERISRMASEGGSA
ncbi:MAG: glycosyltransferase family 2 protein [Phycisphaerales bacterium]